MLKRIISAAVGIGILAVVLVFRDTAVLDASMAFLAAVAVFELYRAVKLNGNKIIEASGIIFTALFVLTPAISGFSDDAAGCSKIIYSALVLVYVMVLFNTMLFSRYSISFEQIASAFTGAVLMSLGFSCYIYIRNFINADKPEATLYMLILCVCGAWLADTGAYFVGTFFGKHKLCPSISPKKSVEGLIGGIVFNTVGFPLLGLLFSNITKSLEPNYILLAILGLFCALAGTVGDLFASYVKRSVNIKDFGKIMPGHGGILDRFDSFLTVVPMIYMLLQIFYKISPVF